ncbi:MULTISPECIES: M20 metallopeptidase family protein [unclassified Sedimentibacter]|uniref:M20 metallopeptidase family protein n=1 Tax=unclassified Sedimentibacter TaxID=2649220 RepID=UPI0027E0736C|nr:M20 family metallopeptidase [Sedimentibacter sp. MB35-C1]WMJ77153.1 M20 family metallopeptidase [Sedimentibacter sp. MB35-C1]
MDIQKRVDEIYRELVDIRRDFHKYPELSQNEFRTQKKIREYLTKWNIENYTCADTGVVGIIRGKKQGRCVGIRGDIDALPICEKNESEYSSVNSGVMHACGHDAHTAILLGVGKILKEMADSEESIKGNVKLFFQPAEETIGGGKRMVEEGCMQNPDVDYMLGLHVMPYIDAGKVELKYGKLNASTDSIKIVLKGKQAHGAYPDKGIDAIAMAGSIITSLQTIVSRNISPLNSAVISLGKISGGVKDNVVADEVEMSGTLRVLDDNTRIFVKQRIENVVKSTAAAFGGEGAVDFYDGYQALINNDEVVDIVKENAEKVLGSENIVYKEFPSLGAEDFSYFSDAAKGAFFHLGCGNSSKGITSAIHTDTFDIDEECLKTGVVLQVNNVLSLLEN